MRPGLIEFFSPHLLLLQYRSTHEKIKRLTLYSSLYDGESRTSTVLKKKLRAPVWAGGFGLFNRRDKRRDSLRN